MPSTVGTTTDAQGTQHSFQQKSFQATGRYWVFYCKDESYLSFCSSTDGINWTSPTNVRSCDRGRSFSIWFDGTYVHYAYSPYSPSGEALRYRRGTPNSNGTITWSTERTAVSGSSGRYYRYPTIAVDSNGCPWIGYLRFDGSSYYWYVTSSTNNAGGWSTRSGFPYNLGTTTHMGRVLPIPLTAQKMLLVYIEDQGVIKSKRWTGSAWGTERSTTGTLSNWMFNAVNEGDDVHLVFLRYSDYAIVHAIYSYTSDAWGTETTLLASAGTLDTPVINRNDALNRLCCFLARANDHIYLKKYSGGSWDASWQNLIDESTDDLTYEYNLTCDYVWSGGYCGILYMTKTASPYNVRFASISQAVDHYQTISETLGILDSIKKTGAFHLAVVDQLGMLDSISFPIRVTIADSLGLVDSITKRSDMKLTIVDQVGLLESVKAPGKVQLVIVEKLGFVDSATCWIVAIPLWIMPEG